MTATRIDTDNIKFRHEQITQGWLDADPSALGSLIDFVLDDVPRLFAEIERLRRYERWWQEMTKGVVMD